MPKLPVAPFLILLVVLALPGAGRPPSMTDVARALLDSLEPEKRAKAVLSFDSENRFDWHYIPRERKGLSLKEMTPPQREAALRLLHAGLSANGYKKAETIRQLETVLREIEGRDIRDPELYFVTIFGEPSDAGVWGWRYEGHHISQNWTLVKGEAISQTPQFFGANPAEVGSGPLKGTRALPVEEDLGRALVKSLDETQRAEAVLGGDAPGDIVTTSSRQAAIQEDRGIPYSRLTAEQKGMLMTLIGEYANTIEPAVAAERLEKVRKAGLDGVKFAWMGALDKGQGHYYRIQGSTFLIEYDNTQNKANHIHTVWRDFHGDFGRDVLAEHYHTSPHHAKRP